MKRLSLALAVLLLFLTCGASKAFAQQCPRVSSTGLDIVSHVQTLQGLLIYHDDIRQWFELKLDVPKCGQRSIQLVQLDRNSKALQVFRGCRIRSSGKIDFSETGYYSRDVYQDVRKVEPVGVCATKRPFPDYSSARPNVHVRAYTVDMHVDYRPGDHPVIFHVRSAGRELRPWQAYATYWLTGGFVLYGLCGQGFVVDRVYGTPAAHPMHFDDPRSADDMAAFDPESAAQSGNADLHLGYTCIREPVPKH